MKATSTSVPSASTTTPTTLLALAAQALLTFIYARALDGLVGFWFLLGALLIAAVLGALSGRSRLRLWVVAIGAAAVFMAVRAGSLGVVGFVAVRSLDPAAATLLQWLDTGTVAAIPVVALGFASAVASTRRVGLRRWEPLVHGLLLLALLWSQAHYDLTYFDRAWAYVLVIGVLALVDVLMLVEPSSLARTALRRAAPRRAAPNRRTVLRGMLLAIALLVVVLLISVRWYSTGGVEAGGGILRPTLFRFDFAPFVQLESEITMSEDLVLLYRRSGRPRRDLIRRYVLTDYDPRRGFSVADDEAQTPAADPIDPADDLERELVSQEYFLVNLDPGTRLALNEPVGFTRFENWDDSSFTAAFSARSMVSRAPPFRLARAGTDGLSASEIRELTDYGDNEPIRLLAEEITEGLDGAFARARAIEAYLHDNYFYSLRPGIAADGDQLAHFLFESRKGYCSYYAFGMALMVRSLGIPARVAVGFFVDPGQEVLNFYPVLANMAHAWVEVYLGEYGWIAFDPTSQTLAPGEEYEFGAGADPNELASLLEEILAQDLRASQPPETADAPARDARLSQTVRSVLSRWYLVAPALYLVFVLIVRAGPWAALLFVREPRRRSVLRVRLVLRWAAACGIRRRRGESLRDFGRRVGIDGMDALMNRYERALFAADLPSDHDARTRLDARRVLASLRAAVPRWRRVAGFLAPRLHRRVTTVALVILFGAGATLAHAQESADWYREQSDEALASERYDRAVNILKEAQEQFDESDEFFVRLGDLYYDEELYALALDEYLEAEAREPDSYEVLEQIAFTLGFLNRERESAEYWGRLVDLYPDRVEPVGNLGWLLFKLHRLDEGVDLLLEAWDRLGPDADLAMTLGTLHAEQYRFAEASDWYRRSIELASESESSAFVAVAFYNLSLIEKLFHRYEDSLESTNRSLGMLARPTGYLARGELHELRMDFSAAHADYLFAYDLDDDTPLARLNLALLYRRYGRLDEALAFAESVLDEPDSSWLYYYGTDVTRHRMELHDLLADIHEGLAVSTRSRLASGPLSWFTKLWDIARHAVLGWYHRAWFREHAAGVGSELLEGGNAIDGNWHLYRASEPRARVAAAYLERTRQLELAVIPESAEFYAVEAARLRGDAAELAALAAGLDSPWDRHLREEALVGALAGRARRGDRAGLAAELFAINPGAFRQNGIGLPVRLVVAPGLDTGRLPRMLGRAGFDVVPEAASRALAEPGTAPGAAPSARPSTASGAIAELRLDASESVLVARLSLPGARATTSVRISGERLSASEINELADSLFAVE